MMKNPIEIFIRNEPSLASFWRSIILFGKNSASYKFALAKCLLQFAKENRSNVTLEELALPYSLALCEHLKSCPKQSTSQTSRFLEGCLKFNEGALSKEALINNTVQLGFNNVLDAFHVVNSQTLEHPFFHKDFSNKSQKKILLTDEVFRLLEMPAWENFEHEIEARWNLVENAWRLNIARDLISYDIKDNAFFITDKTKRKDITSARDALNGYQKGKCFYCFDDIYLNKEDFNCDVDHFFAHTLKSHYPHENYDGVWNLVLSCKNCNRGPKGKFAQVPETSFLERLYRRNEFLISSHHPLRETIMKQTGETAIKRKAFLEKKDQEAISYLIHRWNVEPVNAPSF